MTVIHGFQMLLCRFRPHVRGVTSKGNDAFVHKVVTLVALLESRDYFISFVLNGR